jgi:hypothetical protein
MAKKKEEPKVDNEVGSLKVKEKVEKQPDGNETKDNVTKVKEKMKMKPIIEEETITKVDLSNPVTPKENEEVKENVVNDGGVVELAEDTNTSQEQEEVQPQAETQETPVLEEITEEEKVEEIQEVVADAIVESEETGKPLPENVEKLLNFMEETGGDLNDYVALNQDYSELDNDTLLKEYYKQTKPHLSEEEIEFIMEDKFSFDEDEDEKRDVKRKKLALKEQVAEAKQHLESVKSKYYEDIKSGIKLTKEQQEAIDFFNRYNKESEADLKTREKQASAFAEKTNQLFNDKFKGFEYKVGEKRFRLNVKDSSAVKESQGDINNFIKKFLNKENIMDDAAGYHKSLFAAMNPDMVANHFYEQGKADALKESIAKSKNVDMDPRQSFTENKNTSGFTARVLNDDGPDFKFRIKK